MFIKQVTIHGFKSYKDVTIIEPFHQGYNVIVGRNGSGKSNFFAALEFALKTDFTRMNDQQRNELLHNRRHRAELAYVEIEFDNTDRKLPFDSNTVTFRRILGTKKDRITVNQKEFENVKQFLESAGLMNPYFIVKQGKINELATSSDKALLRILCEIGGLQCFDETKLEIHKVFEKCQSKMKEMYTLLESVEERLEVLMQESKELEEFQRLDQNKRAIEFEIYTREIEKISTQNISRNNEREELMTTCDPLKAELANIDQKLSDLSSKIICNEANYTLTTSKTKYTYNALPPLSTRIAQIENNLQDIQEEIHNAENLTYKQTETVRQIRTIEEKLETCRVKFAAAKALEDTKKADCISKEASLRLLFEKSGRSFQFKTKAQRDDWIKSESMKLVSELENKQEEYVKYETQCNNLEDELKKLNDMYQSMKYEVQLNRQGLFNCEAEMDLTISERSKLELQQRTLWQDSNKVELELNASKETVGRLTERLQKVCGKGVVCGWEGVMAVLRSFRESDGCSHILNGYYGLVLDNITNDTSLDLAVETTAGLRLMHHIVKNHVVSKAILQEFNRQKRQGEVYFMSLEELRVKNTVYPTHENLAVVPLIGGIRYDKKLSNAINYIFGNTLLCDSSQTAIRAAKTYKLNCVTADGDKILTNGVISGGYHDKSLSKLQVQRQIRYSKNNIEQLSKKREEIETELISTKNEIIRIIERSDKEKAKESTLRSNVEKLEIQIEVNRREISHSEHKIKQERNNIEKLAVFIQDIRIRKDSLLAESKEGLSKRSAKDKTAFKTGREKLRRMKLEVDELSSSRVIKEVEKKALEQNLKDLTAQQEELTLLGPAIQTKTQRCNHFQNELKILNAEKLVIEKEWAAATAEANKLQKQIYADKTVNDKLNERKQATLEKLCKLTKDLERLMIAQKDHSSKLMELNCKLQRLGPIPNITTKFEKLSTRDLYKQLKQVTGAIKKQGKVNHKATELYEKASDLKDGLVKDGQDLQANYEKISQLERDLDAKKAESLLKTFQTIQQEFRQIFTKLVPEGQARMALRTVEGVEVNETTVIDGESGAYARDLFNRNKFVGVAIDVNFTGKSISVGTHDRQNLSGGQKSLVSIALILAIQKCDPVPLYLFDEVDQALDIKYRSAVAKFLKEYSSKAQFICTTFSRQFLESADQFFGVSFRNQTSRILQVTQEQAIEFVENDEDSSQAGSQQNN